MDHIGIDVHKKEGQICILAEEGELLERRIRTDPRRSPRCWASERQRTSSSSSRRRASGWPGACGAGWEPLEALMVTIPLPHALEPITVNRYMVRKDRGQQIVFYWYQSQGKRSPGRWPPGADVEGFDSAAPDRWVLVRVLSAVYGYGSAQDTSDSLETYIQAMYPVLGEYLADG